MAGQMSGRTSMSKGKGKLNGAKKPPTKAGIKAMHAKEEMSETATGAPDIAPATLKPTGGTPKSIHMREAEGGYILSKHGGENDNGLGFQKDHVANDFDAAMAMAREHMGGASAKPVVTANEPGPGNVKVRKASSTEE